MTKRASIVLLRDAGLWRERQTDRHIHGWPMLSYLSRFQILDGSPALEHLLSMRKSLIHLPPVPDPLPFLLPLDSSFSLRDSYSAITPIVVVFHELLIPELNFWTFRALLINFIVILVATLQQMRISSVLVVCSSLRLGSFPLLFHLLVVSTIKNPNWSVSK